MARGLRHEDLLFLTSAPVRQVRHGHVALPAELVFELVADRPESWPAWFSLVRECRYEGGPPHDVGTIRRISLRGGIQARERVLAWEEDRRFAYRVEEINMPGVRAAMEEWTVEPVTEDRTEVRWVLAADCAKSAGLLLQAARAGIDRAFREGIRRMPAVS